MGDPGRCDLGSFDSIKANLVPGVGVFNSIEANLVPGVGVFNFKEANSSAGVEHHRSITDEIYKNIQKVYKTLQKKCPKIYKDIQGLSRMIKELLWEIGSANTSL